MQTTVQLNEASREGREGIFELYRGCKHCCVFTSFPTQEVQHMIMSPTFPTLLHRRLWRARCGGRVSSMLSRTVQDVIVVRADPVLVDKDITRTSQPLPLRHLVLFGFFSLAASSCFAFGIDSDERVSDDVVEKIVRGNCRVPPAGYPPSTVSLIINQCMASSRPLVLLCTHSCRTHIFLTHFLCMAYRRLKVFAAHMSYLSISPFPCTCFIRFPCCSLTVTSRPPSRPWRLHLPCRVVPDPKKRVYEPKEFDKIASADGDTTPHKRSELR